MSTSLFLVRVHPSYRFRTANHWICPPSHDSGIVAAFPDETEARRFVENHIPVPINPFQLMQDIEGRPHFYPDYDYNEEDSEAQMRRFNVPLETWFDRIRSLGLPIPTSEPTPDWLEHARRFLPPGMDGPLPSYLRGPDWGYAFCRWWQEQEPRMTEEQKRAIWNYVYPQPYLITAVPVMEDVTTPGTARS